jgi:hypothetical protein
VPWSHRLKISFHVNHCRQRPSFLLFDHADMWARSGESSLLFFTPAARGGAPPLSRLPSAAGGGCSGRKLRGQRLGARSGAWSSAVRIRSRNTTVAGQSSPAVTLSALRRSRPPAAFSTDRILLVANPRRPSLAIYPLPLTDFWAPLAHQLAE